jgi:two-component system OmpR family sensor kinase
VIGLLPRPRASLRVQLLVPLLGLLFVGLAGAPILSSIVVDRHLDERTRQNLTAINSTVTGLLHTRSDLEISPEKITDLTSGSALILVGLDTTARPVFVQNAPRSPASLQALITAAVHENTGSVTPARVDGINYEFVRNPTPGLRIRHGTGALEIAQVIAAADRGDDQDVISTVATAGAAFAVGAMIILGALATWTLRRGLHPLEQMADAAQQIADCQQREDFRVLAEHAAPELARLGSALQNAFDARARAEGAVRSFMQDASHELRTPLTTLSGWLDLYAQGGLRQPGELDHAVERMESEAGRMRLLIEELDLLAHMDQGRDLDLRPTTISPVLQGLIDDIQVIAPDRAITLDVSGEPIAQADTRRLEQVLRNLLGNALQHTPPGTPIEARATAHNATVLIQIIDHGPGVPADDLDRIFERFYRSNPTRPGSGLGLSIVQALVHAHHGTVRAIPTPGGGTTITIQLPEWPGRSGGVSS